MLLEEKVFYSQYVYVVGYVGVERFVATKAEADTEQRFGYLAAVYVIDYKATKSTSSRKGTLKWSKENHCTFDRDLSVRSIGKSFSPTV